MQYQFVAKDCIRSHMSEDDLTPEVIYQHFSNYTDECIYVVEDEMLIGIVTPGDLNRFYTTDGENSYLNKNFIYVDEIDFGKAAEVFERIKTIHEVPVIKEHIFLGIVKSGEQKSGEEWIKIREGFLPFHLGKMEWRKREISLFLEHTQANIYVYSVFDQKKLKWDDNDREIYDWKKKHSSSLLELENMSECEREAFFGIDYSEEYAKAFIEEQRMMRVETHNGISRIGDMSGRYFNVSNGKRKLCSVSKGGGKRRIYFIGPCTVLGAYVRDDQTIESYMQNMVNCIAPSDFEMINCGLPGSAYFHKLLTEEFAKDDIIVYMVEDKYDYLLWKKASQEFNNIKLGSDLTESYNGIENPTGNILNHLSHCNHVINQRIANIIYADIEAELLVPVNFRSRRGEKRETRTVIQDYYISWDIVRYYRQYIEEHNIPLFTKGKVGAIVMNCNPFTKGHRYLIEYASSQVDVLFIFVVEEDQSDFSFSDRFHMVKMGTCDLDNVYVLPSGKYIISKETFSQYFEKDSVTEVQDMEYDLHIFGDVVAKEFGIKVRFVGEEPFDVVTSKYNETMKCLLPPKGVEVVEIPRLKNEEQETISASLVRKYLATNNFAELEKLCPKSTITYLKEQLKLGCI